MRNVSGAGQPPVPLSKLGTPGAPPPPRPADDNPFAHLADTVGGAVHGILDTVGGWLGAGHVDLEHVFSSAAASVTDEAAVPVVPPSRAEQAQQARSFLNPILPSASAEEARQRAELSVWSTSIQKSDLPGFVKLDRSGFAPTNANVWARRDANAIQQLEANQALEAEALGKLTAEQQAAYQRLAATAKDDPPTRLALQVLLLDGKLTDGPANRHGDGLLAALDKLNSQPLAAGIDRSELVTSVLQEVALPSTISQKIKGTCTVTSVQIMTAQRRPAEYARLIGELASPEGKATLANGDAIVREPGTETDDGSERSVSSRLWQPAMMEYGNGAADYDNKTDQSHKPGWFFGLFGKRYSGLSSGETAKVLRGVFDAKDDLMLINANQAKLVEAQGIGGWFVGLFMRIGARSGDDALESAKQALAAGKAVTISMKFADGGKDGNHEVVIDKIENQTVSFTNPWGEKDRMSVDDFKERVLSLHTLDVA